ncbi:Uncharacterised protein [uncultured archaeon]|nr:Uncharacterised protein [uncultured archaeon]
MVTQIDVTQRMNRRGGVDVYGLNPKDAKLALEEANKILGNKLAYNFLQDRTALGKFVTVLKDARKAYVGMNGDDGMNMDYACFYELGGVVARMKTNASLTPKEAGTLKSAIQTLVRAFYLQEVDSYVAGKAEPTAKKIIAELEPVCERYYLRDKLGTELNGMYFELMAVSKRL